MYKVGIIGCGKIAQVRHIPEYLDNKNTEILGYYDTNANRAKEMADKYNGKVYTSYQKLLEDSEIDLVSICTANHVHAEIRFFNRGYCSGDYCQGDDPG